MRPSILNPLFANVETLRGIGSKSLKLLQKLCGDKIVNLMWHLPYNIVDRTYSVPLSKAIPDKIWTGVVTIKEHIVPPSKKQPYKIVVTDGSSDLTLNFFKYYKDAFQKSLPVGYKKAISGKLEIFNAKWQMNHPDYIVIPEFFETLKSVEPVYPLCAGVTNKMMLKLRNEWIKNVPDLPEWQDKHFLQANNFPSFYEAIKTVHYPHKTADLESSNPAKKRLVYDELLSNQLALAIVRQRNKKQAGRSIKGNGFLREKLLKNLSFELTDAQKRVLNEIYQDQEAVYKMLRLVQGDVGSGKTIVAFLSMLNATECGLQSAIMAPTEILAKQHFETMGQWADILGIKIELLTGKIKGKKRQSILEDIISGKVDIIIGTHALFTEDVEFNDLAYVVVDEQHRFGVNQRLELTNKGNNPDILVMTATPIPRTLVLTQYGDMDYSKIDEAPKGRLPTDTRIIPLTKINEVVEGLSRKISTGSRAYWVCPLVEESEKLDLAAAEERYAHLQKIFGDKVGLIHGKMKEKEKDAVMEKFKTGEYSLLVATTVIEVGVNVPEATVMVIENAQRFGLAQLHQLRGRIKRGFEASACILLYGYPLSNVARERLNIMKTSQDGFLIAEKDLELRGGGEILGTRQSGFNEFKLADLSEDKDLLYTAKKDADMVLATDKNLTSPRGQALRCLLYLFEQDEAVKTYLAG
ncbi:MAG: ATP-dependent DNA helicase RecG [Alphaproteobacteria bacterium]|nr:ATP-dependent DNA helicase RecG [Alphaproteobacteria bacterium]